MVPMEEYRALAADARAALRMIREVVEQNVPRQSAVIGQRKRLA